MTRSSLTSPLVLALLLGSTRALAQAPAPVPPPFPPPAATPLPPGAAPLPVPPGPMAPPPMAPPALPPSVPPPPAWQPAPAQPPVWQPPQAWQPPQPLPPVLGQGGQPPVGPAGWNAAPAPALEIQLPVVPLDLRGALALDTASFTDGADAFTAIAVRVLASVPVASRVYVDVRLPLGFTTDRTTNAVLGNAMLGAHGVLSIGKTTWLTIGGALGLPLLSAGTQRDQGFGGAQVPNAFWNIHEYMPSIVPIEARVAIEGEAGPVTMRGEIAPVIMIPISQNSQTEVAIMHAFEAQIGHTIAGGLRVQGVALPTFDKVYQGSFAEGDLYQAAIEPFFQVQQPRYFFRTGVMMPLDKPLGPPLSGSFGFRLGFGVRLE